MSVEVLTDGATDGAGDEVVVDVSAMELRATPPVAEDVTPLLMDRLENVPAIVEPPW